MIRPHHSLFLGLYWGFMILVVVFATLLILFFAPWSTETSYLTSITVRSAEPTLVHVYARARGHESSAPPVRLRLQQDNTALHVEPGSLACSAESGADNPSTPVGTLSPELLSATFKLGDNASQQEEIAARLDGFIRQVLAHGKEAMSPPPFPIDLDQAAIPSAMTSRPLIRLFSTSWTLPSAIAALIAGIIATIYGGRRLRVYLTPATVPQEAAG